MEPQIKALLLEYFGIRANRVKRLDGYDNANYKIETDSASYVLKIYDDDLNFAEILDAENAVLAKLSVENPKLFATPQKTVAGDMLIRFDDQRKVARLLTFLEGECLAETKYTPELLRSFGRVLADLDKSLIGFRSTAIEARRSKWDQQFYFLNRKYISLIKEPSDRKLVEYFFMQAREFAEPHFDELRKSVIHGDANEWNVLVKNGEVSGIIDFGDLFYTPLINEIAIAIAYTSIYLEDPVGDILPFLVSYHDRLQLEEREISLLYYLIPLRLCVSVLNSAASRIEMPKNEYARISEEGAWRVLRKWIRINPLFVEDTFKRALGFDSKNVDTSETDIAKRERHTSKSLSLQFEKPIKMVGAAFQYMFDADGKSYLDCYNNIPHVGHCHPRVVEAGQKAMANLNTNTRYLNDVYNEYAENLLAKFPESLSKVFFVNSGSATTDLAIRLAKSLTNNEGIVVLEHGYHGNTRLGIDVSHYKYGSEGGNGKSDAIIEAEIPDTYKGRFQNNDRTAGTEYAKAAIERIGDSGISLAAFIAEPIVGCGGQIPLPQDYLNKIYPYVRAQGGVCISDEVQTGFGRLGEYFWGFEMHDIVPDIVILGKPMGNGHPMAAVVTTDEIAASFETGMEFFSSFGGNTVSCAIGQAVLNVLEEERLPENAKEVGGYLLGLLQDLVDKYEVCGDARGEGLFLGLELVTSKKDKKPNTELASKLQNKLKEKGILVGTDGPHGNVIKIKPPICFTKENAEELAGNINDILSNK